MRAQSLGVELDEHIQTVTTRWLIAGELGLRTAAIRRCRSSKHSGLWSPTWPVRWRSTACRLEFREGGVGGAAGVGGVRFMLDTEETIRSFDPEWQPVGRASDCACSR
jgi:hypothetical protein